MIMKLTESVSDMNITTSMITSLSHKDEVKSGRANDETNIYVNVNFNHNLFDISNFDHSCVHFLHIGI